jgi:hypothetical protein
MGCLGQGADHSTRLLTGIRDRVPAGRHGEYRRRVRWVPVPRPASLLVWVASMIQLVPSNSEAATRLPGWLRRVTQPVLLGGSSSRLAGCYRRRRSRLPPLLTSSPSARTRRPRLNRLVEPSQLREQRICRHELLSSIGIALNRLVPKRRQTTRRRTSSPSLTWHDCRSRVQ